MKAINMFISCAVLVGVTLAIMLTDDTQPHELNARERGELQASYYVPQPEIIGE